MTERILAIDLGKSGCRAALWAGGIRNDVEGPGAPGLAAPHGAAGVEAAILAVTTHLLRGSPVDIAVAGVAGALAAPDAAQDLARRLCASLPCAEAAVTSDAVTSHAGALGGGPGVVLAAGTGAVAIVVTPDGSFRRTDGWGPWLGDEGSGAWIGFRALRAALRASDGRGPATSLHDAAIARFGPLSGLSAVMEGHVNPPRLAASFAPAVAQAADSGDVVAIALLQRAAEALAGTVRAALGLHSVPVTLTGGLGRLGPPLLDRLGEVLGAGSPPLRLLPPAGTALDGAYRIARRRDTLHAALTQRATA